MVINMLRLKQLREEMRISQEQLALTLHLSQSTISAYELGDRTPDLKTLITIAEWFQVSLDYLAGISDCRQPLTESDLTAAEIKILYAYRQLGDIEKGRLSAYVDGLSSRLS